jgi:hypothetical protein
MSPTWLKIERTVNNKGEIERTTNVSLKLKGDHLEIVGGLWADEEPCLLKKVNK